MAFPSPQLVMKSHVPLPRFASMACSALGLLVCTVIQGNTAELDVPGDFATIQAALNAAVAGDEVRVAPGIYLEFLNFNQKDVELTSTEGAEATILQAPASGPGVIIGPAGSISGFTIRKSSPLMTGTGIVAHGPGSHISSNIFHTNRDGLGFFGAAISMNNASPVIQRNVFRNNSPSTQSLSGVISLINGSSPYIANNIFYSNAGRAINVTVPSSASPVVINNTIVGNNTAIRVDTRNSTANQIYRNNIIYGNNVGFQTEFGSDANNPTWQNNLVSGNGTNYAGTSDLTGISGNIGGVPLFVDAAERNYRLQSDSPAIDAGSNLLAPPMDFDSLPRPIDGNGDGVQIADIGAYEYSGIIIGSINLTVDGGDLQECLSPQGNTVEARIALIPENLQITSVGLFLNGVSVAATLVSQVTLPMGSNRLEAVALTEGGYELRSGRTVEIVDTTAPLIDARFVDRRTGREVSSVDDNGMSHVTVRINANDTCDPDPGVESMLGTEIRDGAGLDIIGQLGQLRLNTDKISLKVLATDASGNVSVATKHLLIRGKKAK
jgi:hypothetical protein